MSGQIAQRGLLGSTKLLDWFPLGENGNGASEFVGFDPEGKIVIRTDHAGSGADPYDVIEANKRFQNDADGYSPSRDMQHIASIPPYIIEGWRLVYGVDPTERGNEDLFETLLNSSDWRHLRKGGGYVKIRRR